MRLLHDRERCEGHGLCAQAAPELLHLDADAEVVVDVEVVDDHLAAARAATRVCPVIALRIEESA